MLDRMFTNDFEQTFDNFRRAVDSLFTARPGTERRVSNGQEMTDNYFVPPIETGWTNEDLNLRVILPGVAQQDVEVTAQGNQLIIRGERKVPEYASDSGFYSALPYGKFERVVTLPNGLDIEHLQAQYQNGLLDVWIPRTAAMKPRKIQIATTEQNKVLQSA